MSDEFPKQTDPAAPTDAPSRPIWLQGLIGLLLAVCALGLMWYLYNRLS